MIISNILTRYLLASFWMRIFIFLLFYVAIRQLHFIDTDFSFAECMPRKKPARIVPETKDVATQTTPVIAESKDRIINNLEKQVKDLTFERTGLRKQISKLSQEKAQIRSTLNRTILNSKMPILGINLEKIENLENENDTLKTHLANVKTHLREIKEQNGRLQKQLAAEAKNKVPTSTQDLPTSGIMVDRQYYASVKDYYLLQQERIGNDVQKLILGHTIDEVLSYVKKRENPTFLDYLNFFSFDSEDPLEDYFYKIHQQHSEVSHTNVELRRDLNNGCGNYSSYLKDDFDKFKNLVVRYKSNSARIQLEAFDPSSIRCFEYLDLRYKDMRGF